MSQKADTSRDDGRSLPTVRPSDPETSTGIRILHVDDDASFGGLVREWLETAEDDLRVTTVTSAESALEHLSVRDHGFDAVVSDFRMPGTNGLELFDRVHERDRSLPFVLFTGQGSEEVARDALTAGVTDYVQKSKGPEAFSLLTRRVRNAVETRRLDAEARRYDALVELLDIAVFVFEEDGRLVSFNDSFLDLVGRSPEDLLEDRLWSLAPDSEREHLDQYVRNLIEEAGPDMVSFQISLLTGGGDRHPCRLDMTAVPGWDGQPESYVCVLRDLTERDRFRLTMTDLLGWATGPYLALDAEWRIAVLNAPAGRLLGSKEPNLVGRSFWDVYPAFEDSSFHDRLAAVAETAEPDEFSTYYGPTAQHFRVRAYPTDTGLAVYFRDITDQVTRERELDVQRRRLAEFASIVSHDLRSPLSVARGHLSMLRANHDGDEEGFDAVDRALDRAATIIDDTMTLTEEVEVDDPTPIDLVEIAERAWEFVETDGATLETVRGPTIRADRTGLQRVLENLLRNSVEHGSGGRAAPDDGTDPVAPVNVTVGWIETDEPTTGFYVEDDGPGIPPADRESVFDPGVTTREDGTGLGLAIVRQVVLAHGWSIRATEGTTGGARFEVTGVDPLPNETTTDSEASYAEAEED